MKPTRILITGRTSYVGTCLKNYLLQYNAQNHEKCYEIQQISVRNQEWEHMSFCNFDVIVHTAGIVHKREKRQKREEYMKVNCALTQKLAQKAKQEGVQQFIFLSSMSIYGKRVGVIDRTTVPKPNTYYGESKWLAEQKLTELAENTAEENRFHVCILRVPMIYGKHCRGNYNKLMLLTKYSPIFPDIENERSMISIKNLLEQMKEIIDEKRSGLFFPQDSSYICTSRLVEKLAIKYRYKIWVSKYWNPFTYLVPKSIREKLFGTLIYKTDEKNGNERGAVWNKHILF